MRIFQHDMNDPNRFVVTMELVPKAESGGRSIDTIKRLAEDARLDGRLSAVSITDNPGGNPSLSPDVLGREILDSGMDVIVHFTCRDMNRAGIQSRALQLERMGMNNILALTGDYSGRGFGGQSAPVFDLDAVNLIRLLARMNQKAGLKNEAAPFYLGCAVSPFKYTEAESHAQYHKLSRKINAGAHFIVTQLGYDARKLQELVQIQQRFDIARIPAMASIFLLTPKSARIMNSGRIPGAVVGDGLKDAIFKEWAENKRNGYCAAIDRAAKLAAIAKGLGFRGIHIGGVHRSFQTVARILDRMDAIAGDWPQFIGEFGEAPQNAYYAFHPRLVDGLSGNHPFHSRPTASIFSRLHYAFLKCLHHLFFRSDAFYAPLLRRLGGAIDRRKAARWLLERSELVSKKLLLGCQECGDCGIQHAGFLCPESQCPKHTRNGACGGSMNGQCEVYPEKRCLWVRAYERLITDDPEMRSVSEIVPPRRWELNHTSSWLNFHLGRDHQGDVGPLKNVK